MAAWRCTLIRSLAVLLAALQLLSGAWARQRPKLPKPRQLDPGVTLERDPTTGDLRNSRVEHGAAGTAEPGGEGTPASPATIRARVNLVEVNCNVFGPDGSYARGLSRDDFRIFEDGVEQKIAHFDASSEPASIALLIDASPSVFHEWEEMKAAARALARTLSPLDAVAVVAFAGQTRLLLPFSRDRALLERAIASVRLALSPAEVAGSNIYLAVYLTAWELFRGQAPRRWRKAIVLLTDGQDSGLGLSWEPATAMPQAGSKTNRLTFEDVSRELAAAGVEVYAVSTQPRPRAMTGAWLEAHQNEMLVTPAARELGMAHYTLYLAELVRRAGGRLYFLNELGTLSAVYRRIAETLGAEYTLGYYPTAGLAGPGWRKLRVELAARDARGAARDARLTHRIAYYVPAGP